MTLVSQALLGDEDVLSLTRFLGYICCALVWASAQQNSNATELRRVLLLLVLVEACRC